MRNLRCGVHICHSKVLVRMVLLLVAVISGACAGEPSYRPPDNVAFYEITDQTAPPSEPPETMLTVRRSSTSGWQPWQSGTLMYYTWPISGGVKTFEVTPPFQWPEPIIVESGEDVIVDLGASATPFLLEVRVFDSVDLTGKPLGDPTLFVCEPQMKPQDDDCRLVLLGRESADHNWRIVIPAQGSRSNAYISVWVKWLDISFVETRGVSGPFIAAWGFSLRNI